ncbi:MAG TPA: DUF58 domain-containing protein [Steroidobacteraceae bacterium]
MAILSSLLARLRRRTRAWARRRHGTDTDPVVLSGRRIYIVPTGLGMAFTLMLFAMFLGAMNYANNLALGLTFTLGALGLTAMHYCHRNLAGIRVASASCEPVFAGQRARFRIALENTARVDRHELTIGNDHGSASPVRIDAGERAVLEIELPAAQRGYLTLDHFEIVTRHPFGLFRAWAYLHMDLRCIVYPKPATRDVLPPPLQTDTGGAQDSLRGDEDFAGLRAFHPGDSPSRIAWKAYAREQGLQVKIYAGTAVTSHLFDWESLSGMGLEARLSQMCRWVEDAHAARRAFGLRLPGIEVPPNIGAAHRQRCLTALALFDADQASAANA